MSEDAILKLLKDLDENRARGLENQSGKFLKVGPTVLAKPLFQICS